MTIIKIEDYISRGSHNKILIKCNVCGCELLRACNNITSSREKWNLEEDYCNKCAQEKRSKSERYLESLKAGVLKGKDHPNYGKGNPPASKYMTLNNPMKRPEVCEKVSQWRKNMPKEIKEKYAAGSRKAWADGKFKNVRVGQCEWFSYIKKNGKEIKLQGTWELAFAKWADEKGLDFITHRNRIPYIFENKERSYYPDFFVNEWNCYVDIKNDYHMSLQEEKFKAIRECNPNLSIKILLKKDLKELGVF